MNLTPKNIFTSLYNGQFIPWERRPVRTDEEKALERKIEEEKQYFTKNMSRDDIKRFDELEDLYTRAGEFADEDIFAYGFKFATMLMFAVFMSEGEPVSKVKDYSK